jgi:hypothetical protein
MEAAGICRWLFYFIIIAAGVGSGFCPVERTEGFEAGGSSNKQVWLTTLRIEVVLTARVTTLPEFINIFPEILLKRACLSHCEFY